MFLNTGLADSGTGLRLRFQNVGEGAHLFVPSVLQTDGVKLRLVKRPGGLPVNGAVTVDGVEAAGIIAENGALQPITK